MRGVVASYLIQGLRVHQPPPLVDLTRDYMIAYSAHGANEKDLVYVYGIHDTSLGGRVGPEKEKAGVFSGDLTWRYVKHWGLHTRVWTLFVVAAKSEPEEWVDTRAYRFGDEVTFNGLVYVRGPGYNTTASPNTSGFWRLK